MRTLIAIMMVALLATSSAFAGKASRIIPSGWRRSISRQLKSTRVASHAIPMTSRLIERSGAFAEGARRLQDCALRLTVESQG